MEDLRNESLKEGMKEATLRMLAARKYALEEIANISRLSLEEVKAKKTKHDKNHQSTFGYINSQLSVLYSYVLKYNNAFKGSLKLPPHPITK